MAWTFYNSSGEALTNFGPVALTDLDIDGGTDIGEPIVDADLFIVDNGADGTNRKIAASGIKTYIGTVPAAASQAEMEAASSNTVFATPGRTQNHPGVAKVVCKWEMAGAHSELGTSYNMTGVSDGGAVGDTDLLWATDFSSAEYAATLGGTENQVLGLRAASILAGGVTVICMDVNGTNVDSIDAVITIHGVQA
jgi:hypothetical protein